MNLFAPISSLMTAHQNLVTVSPEESLLKVKEIFDAHSFHHLPVVRFRELVGIISKTDLEHFLGGGSAYEDDRFINEVRLHRATAQDIMTKRLGKVESTDRLNVAVEIFTINRFHALPVVDNGELVGIITPFDILRALGEEKVADPTSVYDNINTL
ncbi:MAG TPA: CBS domain-containing protein [Saprospiraceae bacterium]|nr:CBS domain-containing protein [Saprospiraceae bacterium]HND89342.1 CBS domain-containing protein [Saprospiraceae bacterium]